MSRDTNGSGLLGGSSAGLMGAEAQRRVMPNEAQAARFIVEEQFKEATGVYPPIACGYFVYVRVYQRDPIKIVKGKDGKEHALITRSNRAVTNDKYDSCVGLVIAMGPQAYTGNNFDGTPRFPEGPWCKIGDWVIIPRHEGAQVTYGDSRNRKNDMVPLIIMQDDKVYGIAADPEYVIATHIVDQDGR